MKKSDRCEEFFWQEIGWFFLSFWFVLFPSSLARTGLLGLQAL
jgi:hypothetical protein